MKILKNHSNTHKKQLLSNTITNSNRGYTMKRTVISWNRLYEITGMGKRDFQKLYDIALKEYKNNPSDDTRNLQQALLRLISHGPYDIIEREPK